MSRDDLVTAKASIREKLSWSIRGQVHIYFNEWKELYLCILSIGNVYPVATHYVKELFTTNVCIGVLLILKVLLQIKADCGDKAVKCY